MKAFAQVLTRGVWIATAVLSLGIGGCQTDAFCFICDDGRTKPTDGGSSGGSGGSGGSLQVNDSGPDSEGGSDAGDAAVCTADIQNDPQNCGACGNRCDLAGAFPKCVAGVCAVDTCGEGLVDLDKNAANGCECSLSNSGTELCDDIDNDCDGEKDEGFDVQTNVEHCGACNAACPTLPHSSVSCAAGSCKYSCESGYSALGQEGLGCPYACPTFPTKTETCDGVDQDCDGVIDNGDPSAGMRCDNHCPGLLCVGECQPGITVCTGTSQGVACVGGTGPTGELCDSRDNDCDGQTDEGFDLQKDVLNCGGCGVQCNSGDPCVNGKCQFACAPGHLDLDGLPGNQCEYACPVFPGIPETCNGIDDDCDGATDDTPSDVGGNCAADCPAVDACVSSGNCSPYAISPKTGNCYGVCRTGGKVTCLGGVKVCQHPSFTIAEACDANDNNCDGRIDEGFDLQKDPLNCGACGTVCSRPNTLSMTCVAGTCSAITACAPGFIDKDGNPANGCEYGCPVFPPVGESCNSKDDDCDGVIDNNVSGVGQTCNSNCPAAAACIAAGNCTNAIAPNNNGCYGACANDGRTTCAAGAPGCSHPAQDPETCNGVDDDCDGLIDDGFNLKTDKNNCGACGNVCSLPGASTLTCVNGICQSTVCAGGFKDLDTNPANGCEYACPVFPTTTETCNGIDDDCDGVKDDAPSGTGASCSTSCPAPDPCVAAGTCTSPLGPKTGSCYGVCRTDGRTACSGGALACTHSAQTSEVCNGLDDDCDGMVDDGFNLQSDPRNCGTCGNVCSAPNATAITCSSGTCSTVSACAAGYKNLDGTLANGCEYHCPVFPPVGESCNGIDDDCNGTADDAIVGLGQSCTANCPAAAACVASGNCGAFAIAANTNGCYGVCGADGRTACTSGASTCAHPSQRTETCNSLDDNCDGRIDDGFNLQTDRNNCGSCGNVCALANTTATTCTTGACQVTTCSSGYANVDSNQSNGCEYKCPVFPTTAETCNGVDDDCDGLVDDSPAGVDVACSDNCPGNNCRGICTTGLRKCVSGSLICQGGGGAQLETCNTKDDDCNGTVDNGFNTATDPVNCGGCGIVCNLPNVAAHSCTAGVCGVSACKPGYANLTSAPGCEYACPVFPTTTETCNGTDDDCDNLVDTADPSMSTPSNFCLQTGPCSGSSPQCQAATGWRCNYPAQVELNANGTVRTTETKCDGFDNNCNGQADETFPLKNQTCTVGTGICARSTTYTCKPDLSAVECLATAVPTDAKDEDCNGKDDNCDGTIDERAPAASFQCYNGSPHACLGWKDAMVSIGGVYMYAYEASRPDSDASNAGVADTRACGKANRLPWTSATYNDAAAACAAVKDSAGNAMRLCTSTEWQTACNAGGAGDPRWSYATNATTYVAGTCNDSNASAGGPWPGGTNGSGAANQCYAPWAGGNIYDLTGNVSEWTSTLVTQGTQNYYRVRGGNYQTFPLGTRCGFNFVLEQPTFANFDLGFRCCSNAAP